jgi:predicted CXXCH cytochrome family protein
MEQACAACHSLAYARVNGQLVSYPHGSIPNLVTWLDRGITGSAAAGAPARQRPGSIRPTSFGSAGARATVASLTAPGGLCVECHTFTRPADGGLPVSSVKLSDRYMAKGGFDHSIPEHGDPAKAKGGQGYKCEDCHTARTSTDSSDLLLPGIDTCRDCHTAAAVSKPHAVKAKTDCAECHSFHKPGVATPPRGHPPLETLRWTETAEVKPAA